MATFIYLADSNNQVWKVGVNDNGTLTTTQQAGAQVTPILRDFQTGLTAWKLGVSTLGALQATNVGLQPSLPNEISLLSNPSNLLWGLVVTPAGLIQTTEINAVTASWLIKMVQSILNDAESDYWNFTLLTPFLQMAYQRLSDKIKINQFRIVRQESVVLSIPANTTVLAYGTIPSLPGNLIRPIYLEERLSGQDDQYWTPMTEREFSVDDIPSNYLNYWWWDGYQLNFVGSNSAEDIKIQYECSLWLPASQGDYILPRGAERFLMHETARNAANSIGDQYHSTIELQESTLALQELVQAETLSSQGLPVRRIGYRRKARGFNCFR